MRKDDHIKYKIDNDMLLNYVEDIKSITEPMQQIKIFLENSQEESEEKFKGINKLSKKIEELIVKYPTERSKIYIDIIKQIMAANNGVVFARMIHH